MDTASSEPFVGQQILRKKKPAVPPPPEPDREGWFLTLQSDAVRAAERAEQYEGKASLPTMKAQTDDSRMARRSSSRRFSSSKSRSKRGKKKATR